MDFNPKEFNLPDEDDISGQFKFSLSYWNNRNRFILDMRKMQNGLNMIRAPKSTQYVIRTLHSYILATLINEKASRYLSRPNIQVVEDRVMEDEDRSKLTRIEKGLNIGGYEIERRSGGDTWDRAVVDAILLDMGVQRILRNESKYWKKLTTIEGQQALPLDSDERYRYKTDQGIPITKEYVPLEYFFPHYDGPELVFSFEVEERTLYDVRRSAAFNNDIAKRVLGKVPSSGSDRGLNTTVNIVHYMDNDVHAYYLGGPGANSGNNKWPKVNINSQEYRGKLELLYAYHHNIDRSQYNTLGGRYGGWKTSTNRIEGVGKGILELAQAADEILSQVLTNVRAKYWPNLNFKMDPEKRGFGVGNSKPEAPKIDEGEPIVTFVGEEILPIFTSKEDPMLTWIWDQIHEQVAKLGGAPQALFGGREPGVDTGYNQALQQTQAQSLDNKLEQHIANGAEEEALITVLHVRAINEPVPMYYTEKDKKKGKKVGDYCVLDPKDLSPMPRFSAQVRKQTPMDLLGAIRAAISASDDRNGKGPLFSDDTIATEFLGIEYPDIEDKKKLLEALRREIVNSGLLQEKIGDSINIKLAKHGTPDMSVEQMQKADPALLATLSQIQGPAAQAGGTDPNVLSAIQPGPTSGDPEMGNRLGEAIQMGIETGATSI